MELLLKARQSISAWRRHMSCHAVIFHVAGSTRVPDVAMTRCCKHTLHYRMSTQGSETLSSQVYAIMVRAMKTLHSGNCEKS